MSVVVLLQARTNSSRLPAKVLLPIEGVPLVVLAALRAANTGKRVIVLTSKEATDDTLCLTLKRWNIEYFRGDLDDPLKRFVDALKSAPNDEIVVRLTGDNVIPDGQFIDLLLEDFESRKLNYLCSNHKTCGLPYGISAEITRVEHLRNANIQAKSQSDREHVTPKIIEKFGRALFAGYDHLNMQAYRCTVDTLEDYLRIARLFKGFAAPAEVPLEILLSRLKSISSEVVPNVQKSDLVLGCAQFGSTYGITNENCTPDQDAVNRIVQIAIANGVEYIDTARSYGNSEMMLGNALHGGLASRVKVITKLSSLEDCPENATKSIIRVYVERSIFKSCNALRLNSLQILLLHRAQHLTSWNCAVWEILSDLQSRGYVETLGVSVQTPDEALRVLDIENVGLIQLPFNILDHRWGRVIKKIATTRMNRKLIIHARSTLLQGLLTTSKIDLWQRAHCSDASEVINWLRTQAKMYTKNDLVSLALQYARSQEWIDGIVIGVNNEQQLTHNIIELTKNRWSKDFASKVVSDRPRIQTKTLNPAEWTYP